MTKTTEQAHPRNHERALAGAPKASRPGRKKSTSIRLEPVQSDDAQDMVATVVDRLTEHIVSGDFDKSGVLPSEGELAISLNVSRTVIREAMRGLRFRGLVEVSQGRAPQVKPPNSQTVVHSLQLLLRRSNASLVNLVEMRQPVESEIAALAAERANDEHIRQLDLAIHDLLVAPDLTGRIAADVHFHHILAEATGNPVFVLLLETLAGFLEDSRKNTLAYSGVDVAVAGHRTILEAVRKHDPQQARQAMHEHLELAQRDLEAIS